MSKELTPAADRKPRNLYAELTYSGSTGNALEVRTRPSDRALRIAGLDFTNASDDALIDILEQVREIAFQAAESSAGIDDVDYWDRWQFDKICSPELVVRLCDLASRLNDQPGEACKGQEQTPIAGYALSRGLSAPDPADLKLYAGGWGRSWSLRDVLDGDLFRRLCAAGEVVFMRCGFNEPLSSPIAGPQGRIAALRELLEYGSLGMETLEEKDGILHVTANWNFVG